MSILTLIANFLFWYPIITSLLWIISGINFYLRKEKKEENLNLKFEPKVTIIIPAHNEEKFIRETLENALKLNYQNYEVVVVDDMSSDKTYEIVEEFLNDDRVHLIKLEKNVGKANAINIALKFIKSDLFLVLDADTILEKDSLKYLTYHFLYYPRLGAVTGNPRVLNRKNILTFIQTAEFSSIISLLKRAQRSIGRIFTISGAVTLFNKNLVLKIGGFSPCTSTEDIDITWRLEKNFYNILYEPRALAYIRVPENLKELIRQRKRWALGGWHLLRKHKIVFLNFKYKRLFFVYLEFILSYLWSIIFVLFTFLWFLSKIFSYRGFVVSPIPTWYGSFISFICLSQFLVSILLDKKYDKDLYKYYLFVVWYPIIYWAINPFLVVITMFDGLFGKLGTKGIWKPPDREINKLKYN